jgi:dTDP-4-amino-4,6-dideoxygalactose transaminase
MNDFTREPEELIQAQTNAVERVIRSGWWVLGNEIKTFEAEWSKWSGCLYTVGVGNGMDALEIGLRALDIAAGDEIITTPMTAFATVLAILRAGATPVLADINPDTAIISPDSVKQCISKKTKAVMVVHLYGQAAPLEEYIAICKEYNIHLIEDCAQAHGAVSGPYRVGTAGSVAGWSFYPTKNLGTIGDGGAMSTQNASIAEKARQLRNYGQSVRYHHPQIGLNSRLDELHAAILRERLKYLNEWTEHRRKIARKYKEGIKNSQIITMPLPLNERQHVHHLFVIRCAKRDALAQYLKENNVEVLIHYPIPVHHQKPCQGIRVAPNGLGNAERHAVECLSLPCNPFLSDLEIDTVIDLINRFNE